MEAKDLKVRLMEEEENVCYVGFQLDNTEVGILLFFGEDQRFYCAFDGDNIASFCIVEDMGIHCGLQVGGPGCVGTLPEYRRKGIGLEMVRRATVSLLDEGYDLFWIHYTSKERWYSKLGYTTVLRWNNKGFIF